MFRFESSDLCRYRSSMWVKSERTTAAKSEAYTSSSLAFDIIDSDRAVCSWLLPLLHDSRLRACFPRYDKQHDVSDACNVADIMHVSLIRHEMSRRVFEHHYNDRTVDEQGEECEYIGSEKGNREVHHAPRSSRYIRLRYWHPHVNLMPDFAKKLII